MRRPILALLIAAGFAGLAACARERVEDAGPTTSRIYAVGDFTKLTVAGPYDVRVTTGGKPGVSATGPKSLLDRLVVEVKGDSLQIHPTQEHFSLFRGGRHASVVVDVTVATLAGAAVAGSGDIAVDKIVGDSFDGSVAGSGSLALAALDVKSFTANIGGSGGIRAAGKAASARYNIAGSGDLELGGVRTDDLEVSVAGSGSVAANAARTAKVSVMGSGDVRVTGGAKCEMNKMGSGDIHCS